MSRLIFAGAFGVGAIAILWIGRLFLGAELLGLAVTVLIGLVYALGTLELVFFRRATDSLRKALLGIDSPVPDLTEWLDEVEPNLRSSVRARIEGTRVGLPAPVVTPYLVGLLVMLGLLGTFIGMVDTLKGAVVALEGNSELEAIRQGLAAPIEGLGLAFGTSVAGVAASAMLGLLSTISRRERIQATQLLDIKIGSELSEYSIGHQQRLAFQAIQQQAMALPNVAERLTDLATNLEQLGEQVSQRLMDNQTQFQNELSGHYQALGGSLDTSLKTTLIESTKELSASIMPMAERTFEQLSQSTLATQTTLVDLHEKHQKAMHDRAEQAQQNSTQALSDTGNLWVEQQQQFATDIAQLMQTELNTLREQEAERGQAAVGRLAELQSTVTEHLSTLGNALEAPMTRLIETASETPKAAADVIQKLRDEISKNVERDNELIAERTRLLDQFEAMSQSLQSSSSSQREAVEGLIERSAETLQQLTTQFAEQVQGESGKLADVVEHFATSSADMASLGEAFTAAVTVFSESNQELMANLNNIETALEKSNSRSDEQLAYYVAQAREIIDHNLLSHQQIINAIKPQAPEQLAVNEVK